MTTIIVSDTHLGDRFNKRKFAYLKRIFSQTDRIILNGDFWDGHLISFDKFINGPWQQLFPLLKSKKTIYIYGNHDNKNICDDRVKLFSTDQATELKVDLGKYKIVVEHGDRIAPVLTEKLYLHVPIFLRKAVYYIARVFITYLPLYLFGKKFYRINKRRNNKMILWSKNNLPSDHFLICGHSHLAELNFVHRFANSGFIRGGYGQYIRIEDGFMQLVDERY